MNANVAIRSASTLQMSVFNRYEDKPTADEVKRSAIAAELTRRGVAVSRVSL